MRILVLGAGVIGSVYAGRLARAGHAVALLARGPRLADLRGHGLVLEDAATGRRVGQPEVRILAQDDLGASFDLVLVPVRRDQLDSTLPLLAEVGGDVLFFGNTAGRVKDLTAALGGRALFGFPAAGGVRDGAVIRYVMIRQQRTMLAEPSGAASARLRQLERTFHRAGFPVHVSADAEGWLMAHAALVVPISLALYRVGVDPHRLAASRQELETMVAATSQAFRALRAEGNREIPRNLLALYLALPRRFTLAYWRRTLAGPNGELWFGAHTRAAPEEMHSLCAALIDHVGTSAAPDLVALAMP